MNRFLPLMLLFFSIVLTPLFTLEGIDLFDDGVDKYRLKEYEEALILLEKFRIENPGDKKSDDALWYLGRIYKYLDRIDQAELSFREILTIKNSNRITEAAYDLGRILYSKEEYEDNIILFSGLPLISSPDSYEIRSLRILADSYYSLGYLSRQHYKLLTSAEYFIRASEMYDLLLSFQVEMDDRSETLYDLGKTYRHLANLGVSKAYYQKYFELSLEVLGESELEKAKVLLRELEKNRKSDFQMEVTLLGGMDNLVSVPGLDLEGEAIIEIPLAFNLDLSGRINYRHNDFSFKTFNFDPLETVDENLVQSTDKISADIILDAGNSRSFLNTTELGGAFRFSEDDGDNYYEFHIENDGSWRINKFWKTGWDSTFNVKIFPDYLVDGHKIDSVQGEVFPFIRWYPSDNSYLTFIYGLNIKQYLDAKYDTSDPGILSTEDRQYISNSFEVKWGVSPGSILDLTFSYEFRLLESNNYDVRVSDTSATEIFMEDYYDYRQHTISTAVNFQWSDRFRTDLDFSAEFRNFTNYIVRDSAGLFSSNREKRNDLSLSFMIEAGIIVTGKNSAIEGEIITGFWWDESVSNMKYESSFDTNSTFFGGLLGMVFSLP